MLEEKLTIIRVSGNVMVVICYVNEKIFFQFLSIIPNTFLFIFRFFFSLIPKPNHLLVRAQNANDRLSLFIFIYKILLKYNSNRSSCHAILNTYNIGWWFNQMYYLWYHIYVCYSYLPLTPFLIIFYLWDICVK